jgi:pimeloyl-ACP methyl ester carboxylesterase
MLTGAGRTQTPYPKAEWREQSAHRYRSHLPPGSIDLSTHIDDMVGEIKWKDLDGIVLVGHSFGGMVITGVAEQLRNRISAIVYLDAFLPADG